MGIRRVFGAYPMRLVAQDAAVVSEAELTLEGLGPYGVIALIGILAAKGMYDLAQKLRNGDPLTPEEATEVLRNANAVQNQSHTMWENEHQMPQTFLDTHNIPPIPGTPGFKDRLIKWGEANTDWIGPDIENIVIDAETGKPIPNAHPDFDELQAQKDALKNAPKTKKPPLSKPPYQYDPKKDPFRKKPDMKWGEFVNELRKVAQRLIRVKPHFPEFSMERYAIARLTTVMTSIVKIYPYLYNKPDALRQVVMTLKLLMNEADRGVANATGKYYVILAAARDEIKTALELIEDRIGRF